MSRRPRPRAAKPARPSPRRLRQGASRWLVAPVVALVVLGYVIMRVLPRRRPLAVPPHPAERLGADDAYQAGLELGRAGHHLAALPYFASAVRQRPDSWSARQSYASALYNGAQEARVHLGKEEPATRSSVERIAMVRAAMAATDLADSLAQSAQDHAVIAFQRAQTLHTFGLATDAMVQFRRARALDPASAGFESALRKAELRLASGGRSE